MHGFTRGVLATPGAPLHSSRRSALRQRYPALSLRLRRGRPRGPPVRASPASARSAPPPPARLPVDPAPAAGASPGRRSASLGSGSGGASHLPRDPRMAPKLSDSAERLRAAGNQSFRNGQFSEAASLYSRALRVMQEQGTRWPRFLRQGCCSPGPPGPRYPEPAPSLPPWGFHSPRPADRPPAPRPFPAWASCEKLPWPFLPPRGEKSHVALLLVLFHLMTGQKHIFIVIGSFTTFWSW